MTSIRNSHDIIKAIAVSITLSAIPFYAIADIKSNPKNHNIETQDSVKAKNLDEFFVYGSGADRNRLSVETGKLTLTDEMILNLPVMFAEPDVVKSLQTLPGVSMGVEGFSSLLVRGGDDDQNLFILQGIPLYHVSHLGGIFSSFNVAAIDKVDFYKGSFPARYGGRTSSVVDIRMKNPDFSRYHGKLSVGLLCANIYFTGPVIKDRSAFSFSARRTWAELVTIPAIAIMNSIDKEKGKKHMAGYGFTDLNLRLDHRFNNKASATIAGYFGHDNLRLGLRETHTKGDNTDTLFPIPDDGEASSGYFDDNSNHLSWGNWGVMAEFAYRPQKGRLKAQIHYSSYFSTYRQNHEYQGNLSVPESYGYNNSKTTNGISELGVLASYSSQISSAYTLDAGAGYSLHSYNPEGLENHYLHKGETSTSGYGSVSIIGNEEWLYADNTFTFGSIFAFTAGVRAGLFHMNGKSYGSLEPRAVARVSLSEKISLKASYGRMRQMVQQVSNNYISLPTDLWQPLPKEFKPLTSDQYSLGIYMTLPRSMYFSLEGWYKNMNNILEYKEGISILQPELNWDEKLTSGKGWSYGLDFSLSKDMGSVTGSFGYGLMWAWRKFDEINRGRKYPAKFDNRHKINININYKLNKKIEFNAGWTYMTGNRMTMSMYSYDHPDNLFPNTPEVTYPTDNFFGNCLDYISGTNNIRMPAYHRLDLGMRIRQFYKNGNEGVWTISVYNAYCHMNTITIQKDGINNKLFLTDHSQWHRLFRTLSLLPVIPSFSYTYIF